ncbi:MAG: hypothetical protein NVS3B20_14570 [Polyangiales bacterium]
MVSPGDAPVLLALKSAVIQGGAKSIGSTSLVLKVSLDGGIFAAFKPESKKHGRLWRSEVAAYRLSQALALDNVPPSTPRAVKLTTLLRSARNFATTKKINEEIVAHPPSMGNGGVPMVGAKEPRVDNPGSANDPNSPIVNGAMIAWLPGLREIALERDPLLGAERELLTIGSETSPPQASKNPTHAKALAIVQPLAPQISTMVAFDHLTGNVDRFSGNNTLTDMTGMRLVFLDNNLSFIAKLDPSHESRRNEALRRTERFSRRLIALVRRLERADLVAIFGSDQDGGPLLTDAQIDACLLRKMELLKHVDALIETHGEAKVLSFE